MTAVEICNIALSNLGVSARVEDITTPENTKAGELCNLLFEHSRRSVLRKFPWSFARRYASLTKIATDPNNDWGFSYQYPVGCLNVRRIVTSNGKREPVPAPFEVGGSSNGRLIYCNLDTPVTIEYTHDEKDTTLFDPTFEDALAWDMSVRLSTGLDVSPEFVANALKKHAIAMSEAERVTSNEESPQEEPDPGYIQARR